MRVEELSPRADPRWAELVDRAGGSVFVGAPWLQTLEATYGFAVRALGVTETAGGPLLAGVPLVDVDDLFGARTVGLPFSDVCDPLVCDPAAAEVLAGALRSASAPVHLRVRDPRRIDLAGWSTTKTARWHVVPVARSEEEQWAALHPSARRAVRRARAAGLEVRPLQGPEELDQLVALHHRLRKVKYRSFAQPPAFFHAMADAFAAIAGWHALGAFDGHRLVAGTIYLRWGQTLVYKINTSALDALAARPNNVLLWEGLRLAGRLGCAEVDLGPSDDDQPGLIRFKEQHGARGSELRFLRHQPDGWVDRGAAARSMMAEVTAALTEPWVPDEVTARVGAAVYRLFA